MRKSPHENIVSLF